MPLFAPGHLSGPPLRVKNALITLGYVSGPLLEGHLSPTGYFALSPCPPRSIHWTARINYAVFRSPRSIHWTARRIIGLFCSPRSKRWTSRSTGDIL